MAAHSLKQVHLWHLRISADGRDCESVPTPDRSGNPFVRQSAALDVFYRPFGRCGSGPLILAPTLEYRWK